MKLNEKLSLNKTVELEELLNNFKTDDLTQLRNSIVELRKGNKTGPNPSLEESRKKLTNIENKINECFVNNYIYVLHGNHRTQKVWWERPFEIISSDIAADKFIFKSASVETLTSLSNFKIYLDVSNLYQARDLLLDEYEDTEMMVMGSFDRFNTKNYAPAVALSKCIEDYLTYKKTFENNTNLWNKMNPSHDFENSKYAEVDLNRETFDTNIVYKFSLDNLSDGSKNWIFDNLSKIRISYNLNNPTTQRFKKEVDKYSRYLPMGIFSTPTIQTQQYTYSANAFFKNNFSDAPTELQDLKIPYATKAQTGDVMTLRDKADKKQISSGAFVLGIMKLYANN